VFVDERNRIREKRAEIAMRVSEGYR